MNERSATAAPAATVPLTAVEKLLADTLTLQADLQWNMDRLATFSCKAVNTPGTTEHRQYNEDRAARDTLTAPLMALQALINTARKA